MNALSKIVSNRKFFNFQFAPTSLTDSYRAMKQFGVSRSMVNHILINDFHIHDSFLKCLSQYYLLHWESEFASKRIADGEIIINGKAFQVVYHCFNPSYLSRNPKSQIRLSFREAAKEYNLPAYVLVTSQHVQK